MVTVANPLENRYKPPAGRQAGTLHAVLTAYHVKNGSWWNSFYGDSRQCEGLLLAHTCSLAGVPGSKACTSVPAVQARRRRTDWLCGVLAGRQAGGLVIQAW